MISNVERTCGNPTVKANALVFNGNVTRIGDWPWLTAIYYNQNGNPAFICGGTLISNVIW